jgi:hypothetical protein
MLKTGVPYSLIDCELNIFPFPEGNNVKDDFKSQQTFLKGISCTANSIHLILSKKNSKNDLCTDWKMIIFGQLTDH